MHVHVYMYMHVIIYPSNHLGGHQPSPAGLPREALQGPPRGLSLEHGAWSCQGWQVVAVIGTPPNLLGLTITIGTIVRVVLK